LDYLYRRRLFIDRRSGDEISYQYHTLFREFLLDRASNHFSLSELLDIKRAAAHLGEQNGDIEAAAKLFAETEGWQELIRMINGHAPLGQVVASGVALVVPEPQAYAMFLAGLGLIGFIGRVIKRASSKTSVRK